jgi:hypothetical protein
MQERKTDPIEKTTGNAIFRTHHLRMPFIRDVYWTSLSNLILDIPIKFYFAFKREVLYRRHLSDVRILGFKFELLYPYAATVRDELSMWEKNYLPVPVNGKTVLGRGRWVRGDFGVLFSSWGEQDRRDRAG